MSYLSKLNKKLYKLYEGCVEADVENDVVTLSGELERYNDVVFAGNLAAFENPYIGVVNDITCTTTKHANIRKPSVADSRLQYEEPDVLIIGGGIIGCAIARELSRYRLNILLVEKEHDLAIHASGRNTGIIHAGVDLKKGTLRHKYNKLGNKMYPDICNELGVKYEKCGQILCFTRLLWDPLIYLSLLFWKWAGFKNVRVISGDELYKREPELSSGISSALLFTDTAIINPFDLTIAYAENAVQNGVQISFDTMVQSMTVENGEITSVKTNRGTMTPKIVVNAAGAFSDTIAEMAEDRFFSIHPRKGTILVADKKDANILVRSVVTPRKTLFKKKKRKNIVGGFTRTVYNKVLVGPDEVEIPYKEDFTTFDFNKTGIFSELSKVCSELTEDKIINYFSGVQAATYEEDFIIQHGHFTQNIIHAAGIQTPGLTAAPAIATDVADMIVNMFGGKNVLKRNDEFNPIRLPTQKIKDKSNQELAELIERIPDYGVVICSCEQISKGEVLDALRRNVRCNSLDGIKRRARTGTGCCQGGSCTPQVLSVLVAEKRLNPQNVRKSGSKSEVLLGSTKMLLQKKEESSLSQSSGNDVENVVEKTKRKRSSAVGELTEALKRQKGR
ncbi:MAG: FAD-dependent oxidoreductase [Oscillospiraceae bacterium]|jgi:glycerol-3-phosphate dehydrogenase|nr:FAD-dependent oxidoreductase [Oscillospiraceae bacterium]